MRLGPQVQQFGGLKPGKLVIGRDPKMPTGAVGNLHFWIPRTQRGPSTKSHHLLGGIRQVRQSSSAGLTENRSFARVNDYAKLIRKNVSCGKSYFRIHESKGRMR